MSTLKRGFTLERHRGSTIKGPLTDIEIEDYIMAEFVETARRLLLTRYDGRYYGRDPFEVLFERLEER